MMIKSTMVWFVTVSYKPEAWSKTAIPHEVEYKVVAESSKLAGEIAWAAYCEEHLTELNAKKDIYYIPMNGDYWVQS